jgi:glycine cleavage system H protein
MATEFDEGRCWYKENGNKWLVGVTQAAIDEVGQVDRVQFPSEGDTFEEGDVLVEIDGSIGTFELAAPCSGTVLRINEALQEAPEVLVDDPLEVGWLLRIETD